VLHDSRGEHLAGVVGSMLLEESAQGITAAGHRKADREHELVAEGSVVQAGTVQMFW
jgi:hypothetical protein